MSKDPNKPLAVVLCILATTIWLAAAIISLVNNADGLITMGYLIMSQIFIAASFILKGTK